jgi:hypothetical protein
LENWDSIKSWYLRLLDVDAPAHEVVEFHDLTWLVLDLDYSLDSDSDAQSWVQKKIMKSRTNQTWKHAIWGTTKMDKTIKT